MRKQTEILGKPVWFAVCCSSECSSKYIGPFFSEEEAGEESNIGCDYSHFLATYAPEFAIVIPTPRSDDSADKAGMSFIVVNDWIDAHNAKVEKHPIYHMALKNVDLGRENPLWLTLEQPVGHVETLI